MGKGDKKSKKGKISMGSYGNSRKKRTAKKVTPKAAAKKGK
jgi:ribosomal small subunit protein bTHX